MEDHSANHNMELSCITQLPEYRLEFDDPDAYAVPSPSASQSSGEERTTPQRRFEILRDCVLAAYTDVPRDRQPEIAAFMKPVGSDESFVVDLRRVESAHSLMSTWIKDGVPRLKCTCDWPRSGYKPQGRHQDEDRPNNEASNELSNESETLEDHEKPGPSLPADWVTRQPTPDMRKLGDGLVDCWDEFRKEGMRELGANDERSSEEDESSGEEDESSGEEDEADGEEDGGTDDDASEESEEDDAESAIEAAIDPQGPNGLEEEAGEGR